MSEHLFIQDLRKHPLQEVRLYVDRKLMSGTSPVAITGELDRLRAALVAIQEQHKPVKGWSSDREYVLYCSDCGDATFPCTTRRLADEALGETNGWQDREDD